MFPLRCFCYVVLLQRAAACCSVLQRAAACCSVCCSVLQRFAACATGRWQCAAAHFLHFTHRLANRIVLHSLVPLGPLIISRVNLPEADELQHHLRERKTLGQAPLPICRTVQGDAVWAKKQLADQWTPTEEATSHQRRNSAAALGSVNRRYSASGWRTRLVLESS